MRTFAEGDLRPSQRGVTSVLRALYVKIFPGLLKFNFLGMQISAIEIVKNYILAQFKMLKGWL